MQDGISRTLTNNGTTLRAKIFSEEKKDTIVLLHGGPGLPDPMTEVVDLLKNRFRVITFDQRGTGKSICAKCNFTMEEYISDLDFIANEFGIDTFHLFGHSWGGLYAQIYAQERPTKIKSLFLSSPSSGTNKAWVQTEKEVLQFNKKAATLSEWLKMGYYSLLGAMGNDKAYGKVYRQVLINYHKGYGDVSIDTDIFKSVRAITINRTRKHIRNYKPLAIAENPLFPIMITYGENDIYGPSKEKVHDRFPTAKFETIRNSGHIPWKHNPKLFNQTVLGFYSNNSL